MPTGVFKNTGKKRQTLKAQSVFITNGFIWVYIICSGLSLDV